MNSDNMEKIFTAHQQDELNGSLLYHRMSQIVKNPKEKETLEALSQDEKRHSEVFRNYTGHNLKPNIIYVNFMLLLKKILGYTFLIKLVERGETKSLELYVKEIDTMPELKTVIKDEEHHEELLITMLDEERLHYTGDIILGMNDALVELTGSLAGYTLAMQNSRLIAMAGLITGISATLSMAGSGYLSSRENNSKNAVKSTIIIGFSYLITVILLIFPYLIFSTEAYIKALISTIIIALIIIAVFNYYLAVAKERNFKQGFFSMAFISLGVAIISFGVGYFVKHILGIDL